MGTVEDGLLDPAFSMPGDVSTDELGDTSFHESVSESLDDILMTLIAFFFLVTDCGEARRLLIVFETSRLRVRHDNREYIYYSR